MVQIKVSVQAQPRDGQSWRTLARDVERLGFDGLFVADHPGSGPAPFVALAAAAAVTQQVRLGTYVVNAGAWEPLALASQIATLDVVSDGRALLGVGAGHTPDEWTSVGRPFPSAGERVDRMIEVVSAVRELLDGASVTRQGRGFALADARLAEPRPVQQPIPLLIGGNGKRVLRYAAAEADIVGVTGLGATQPDGHTHDVDWSPSGLARTFDILGDAGASQTPEIDALVQHVEISDDAEAAASAVVAHVPSASVADILAAPFVWIGSPSEIAAQLAAHQQRWGITRYTVRAPALRAARQVLDAIELR